MQSRTQIRQTIRARRLSLSSNEQCVAANLLVKRLVSYPKVQTAKHIAIYLTNDGELDTMPFIQWCWSQLKSVYLPVVHPFSKGYLLFLKYTPDTPMCKNKFGILEPKLNVNNIQLVDNVELIFTPLVAFDESGARLGMGGGFYDRTLQKWFSQYQQNKNIMPHPIGLAHNVQLVASIPSEDWDIPLPEVITPTHHYHFN